MIEASKASKNGRVPYVWIHDEVCSRDQKNSSWLTQVMMNSAWKRYKQKMVDVQNSERKPSEIYLSQSTTLLGTSLSDLSELQISNKG